MDLYSHLDSKLSEINKKTKTVSSLNLAHLNGGILNVENEVTFAGNVVPNFAKTTWEIRLSQKEITTKLIKEIITAKAKELNVKIKNLDFNFT